MNPLLLAKDLAKAILASEQYREFDRVKEAMDASEEASNFFKKLHELEQVLRESKLQGNNIMGEQLAELAIHQRQMLANFEINTYFTAKKNLDELLATINETISDITGMETGRGHGHGGGGCGCACG
ncbi:MAG: hypothetical protein DDT19_00144 [Syntrophomonadaceae bacterium]|nr:hypothetical protein [Bacillota bacterium]